MSGIFHCALCTSPVVSFSSVEELEVHIAADHVNYVPYECEKCRFSKFPTEFALSSHCRNDHGLKEFFVKYKVTPDTDRKRSQVRDLLEKSVTLSCGANLMRNAKRKRTSAVEVVHTSVPAVSPCSSLDSEENPRTAEVDRNVKTELPPKEDNCEGEESSAEKEGTGQRVVVAPTGEITLSCSKLPNFAGGLGEVFPSDANQLFDVGLKGFDPIADISQTFLSHDAASQAAKTRRRPPRTCNVCGLQVTGQRSSLVYHANSKHLKLPLFYCRSCDKTWSTVTKSDIIKHVKAVHCGDESGILDYRAQYTEQIREMTDKCFPPKHKGSSNEEEEPEGTANADAILWLNSEEPPIVSM